MEVRCNYDKLVKIEALTPNPANENQHTEEQIERIAKILQYQGWRKPIIVSKGSGLVVTGHCSLLSAKKNKWTEVPVSFQDFDNDDMETAHRIADNAIASWADLDLSSINLELPNLGPDFDIEMLGLKDFEIEPADKYGDKDADNIPESRTTDIKTGDVFLLGVHRLMCGDSTNVESVFALMNGEKADMCFTSPPYSDQRDYAGNLNLDPKHLAKFLSSSCDIFVVNLGLQRKDHEIVQYWEDYFSEAKSTGLKLLGWNVWNQMESGSIGKQSAMFPIEHEWIFIFGKSPIELNKTKDCIWAGLKHGKGSRREIDGSLTPKTNFNVGDKKKLGSVLSMSPYKQRNEELNHPAVFPVSFPEEYILACTDSSNDIVFDPFGGSGSTLIACQKTGRSCKMMEIDPQYCQVIIDRWEKFTGLKAVKL